jgi:hypothetical protein
MLLRFVIDVVEGKMELSENPAGGTAPATLLNIAVNRFIPADFVFRCKVVEIVKCGAGC